MEKQAGNYKQNCWKQLSKGSRRTDCWKKESKKEMAPDYTTRWNLAEQPYSSTVEEHQRTERWINKQISQGTKYSLSKATIKISIAQVSPIREMNINWARDNLQKARRFTTH